MRTVARDGSRYILVPDDADLDKPDDFRAVVVNRAEGTGVTDVWLPALVTRTYGWNEDDTPADEVLAGVRLERAGPDLLRVPPP